MAEYNFEQLYAWLQEEERSLNWGMMSFMDREKLNRLLLQVYIRRFKNRLLPQALEREYREWRGPAFCTEPVYPGLAAIGLPGWARQRFHRALDHTGHVGNTVGSA
ncbi:hypothetical protein ABH853_07495 [Pseudomonas sp. 13.2]|uniref:Uncharacterized protein n=1 Tax=Pseudomonas sp. 13.2 TaxID=3144665 RepID=A0AAU7BJQ5_9PSED